MSKQLGKKKDKVEVMIYPHTKHCSQMIHQLFTRGCPGFRENQMHDLLMFSYLFDVKSFSWFIGPNHRFRNNPKISKIWSSFEFDFFFCQIRKVFTKIPLFISGNPPSQPENATVCSRLRLCFSSLRVTPPFARATPPRSPVMFAHAKCCHNPATSRRALALPALAPRHSRN